MEKWGQICVAMSQQQAVEHDVEDQFIECWEKVLGWPHDSVERQFAVQVGHETKFGDILLANTVIVEAKRQGVNLFDEHVVRQLESYMRVRRKKFGMLLGDELLLFYDDYLDEEDDLKLIGRFSFDDAENSAAAQLMELLSRDKFAVEKLINFCQENWNGKYMLKTLNVKKATKKSHGTSRKNSEKSRHWREYWDGFKQKYQSSDGILSSMQHGTHNDLFVRNSVIAGQKSGIQFGLAKGMKVGMRKAEIRIPDLKIYERFFEPNKDKIYRQLNDDFMTGSINVGKTAVINCYFRVSDNDEESWRQIYEAFKVFEKIILNYYTKE